MGRYQVWIKGRIERRLRKLPKNVQETLANLLLDLESFGPVQRSWANFSALGEGLYHCHLTRRYVACWSHEKGTQEIEVYYAGSREDAPY